MLKNLIDIKVINLKHRTDRRLEAIEELSKISITDFSEIFFDAKYIENNGAIGCALSHGMLISNFLYNSNSPFLLILEDDFEININLDFLKIIREIINYADYWDVFLLGHNQAIPIEGTKFIDIQRVINSQTMSGYLISRNYAPKLIASFFTSANLLKKYEELCEPNKKYARNIFCCDQNWKDLQVKDKFWASIPALIKQRKSFSDIEKKIVDYGV